MTFVFHIKIYLYLQVFYEFLVNGKSVIKAENTKPTLYKNVKVWVAQGIYYPVTNARIKDLEYEQKCKYEILKTFFITNY